MLTLGEKIKEIRKEHNLNQSEFGELFGLTQNTITNIENDKRFPTYEILIEIAKRFNISVDYLLGLSEAKTNDIELKAICDYTGLSEDVIENLHDILIENDNKRNKIIDGKFINDFLFSTVFWQMVVNNRIYTDLNVMALYYLAVFFDDYNALDTFTIEKDTELLSVLDIFMRKDVLLYKNQQALSNYNEKLPKLLYKIEQNNLIKVFEIVGVLLSKNYKYKDVKRKSIKTKALYYKELANKMDNVALSDFAKLKEIYERYKDE